MNTTVLHSQRQKEIRKFFIVANCAFITIQNLLRAQFAVQAKASLNFTQQDTLSQQKKQCIHTRKIFVKMSKKKTKTELRKAKTEIMLHEIIAEEFCGELVSNIGIEKISIPSNISLEEELTKPLDEYQAIPRPSWESKIIVEEASFALTVKNDGPTINCGEVGIAYRDVDGNIITNMPILEFENHIPFIRSLASTFYKLRKKNK